MPPRAPGVPAACVAAFATCAPADRDDDTALAPQRDFVAAAAAAAAVVVVIIPGGGAIPW